jgi:HindVP restriction endonuclease
MRDRKLNAVYVHLADENRVECSDITIDELFNTSLPNDELYFDFESRFEPYQRYSYDPLERVDLVVREKRLETVRGQRIVSPGAALRALEVKLTVIPDSATYADAPTKWGPELVVRPPTTMYCGLGMADSADSAREEVRQLFLPVGQNVIDWGNATEAEKTLPAAIDALDRFQSRFFHCQRPLIMQPIWKTKGKTPMLDEQAFDIFVWSDFALARVFINLAKQNRGGISRHARSTLRLARFLYEYGRASAANVHTIYAGMTFRHQSDKEFSLNGRITSSYMNHPRLAAPSLTRHVVKDIILDGGEKNLSPERRFDQTVFFTYGFEQEHS